MIKRFISILMLASVLTVAQPAPAHATGLVGAALSAILNVIMGIINPLSNMVQQGNEIEVINSAVNTFWETFSAQFQLQMRKRMGIVDDTQDQALATADLGARVQIDNAISQHCPGVAANDRATIAAGDAGASNQRLPRGAARPQTVIDPHGDRPRLGAPVQSGDHSPGARASETLHAGVDQALAVATGASENSAHGAEVKTVKDMDYRNEWYRNCASEGNVNAQGAPINNCTNGKMPDADLNPQVIFDNPTFRSRIYQYVGAGGALVPTTEARPALDWMNAAKDYCTMAIMPDAGATMVRARNETTETAMARFGERAQNARLVMAFAACMKLVAERNGGAGGQDGISLSDPGYGWLKDAVCRLRAGVRDNVGALGLTGNAANLVNNGVTVRRNTDAAPPIVSQVVGGIQDITDSRTYECTATNQRIQVSDYEIMRIASSDFYGTSAFAQSLSGSTNELLQVLVSTKAIQAQLDQRIYDLHERASLLDAAMLAVDVEAKRGK